MRVRLAVLLLAAVGAASAQDAPPVRVFVDCAHAFCDDDVIREEVDFVAYVRDPADADVYALSVAERTSNGTRVTVFLEGRGPLAPLADTLRAFVPETAALATGRAAVVGLLGAGLPRYLAHAGAAGRVVVRRAPERGPDDGPAEADDPWRGYVFRVGLGASAAGEQQFRSLDVDASAAVARTTEAVKLRGDARWSVLRQAFEIDDDETFTDVRANGRLGGSVVWSATDRLSYGAAGGLRHAPFSNVSAEARAAAAFELSLYPYAEASRRQVALIYEFGATAVAYEEETVFLETAEASLTQSLRGRAEYVQPWGTLFGAAEARQRPFEPVSLDLDVSASVRLSRGLSLDVTASYAAVRDQRSLRRGEATPEEVLLRLRELETGFRYFTTVGLSYTFGSAFAGAVNPRFDY